MSVPQLQLLSRCSCFLGRFNGGDFGIWSIGDGFFGYWCFYNHLDGLLGDMNLLGWSIDCRFHYRHGFLRTDICRINSRIDCFRRIFRC